MTGFFLSRTGVALVLIRISNETKLPPNKTFPNLTLLAYLCVRAPPDSASSCLQSPKEPACTRQPQEPCCHPQTHPKFLSRPASVRVSLITCCPRQQYRYDRSSSTSQPQTFYTYTTLTAAPARPQPRQTLLEEARISSHDKIAVYRIVEY